MLQAKRSDVYDNLVSAYNGDYLKAKAAVQDMYGGAYNDALASISVSKKVEKMGMSLAIAGDYAFQLRSDTGGLVDVYAGLLLPMGNLQHTAIDEASGGMLKPQPELVSYSDAAGNKNYIITQQRRADYAKENTRMDENGVLQIADKRPGQAISQSLSAILTHAADASMQKIAIIAQNLGRKTSMPNVSIHDANKLNAVSYLHHWVAYNNIAMVSTAASTNTYKQVFDLANKAYDHLMKTADTAAKQNRMIAVGTGANTEYRALFGVLDYYADQVAGYDEASNNDLKEIDYDRAMDREKKYKRNLKLLQQASENGWMPKPGINLEGKGFDLNHTDSDRLFVAVKPNQFKSLVNIAFQLNEMRLTETEKNVEKLQRPRMYEWIASTEQAQNDTLKRIKRGQVRFASQG